MTFSTESVVLSEPAIAERLDALILVAGVGEPTEIHAARNELVESIAAELIRAVHYGAEQASALDVAFPDVDWNLPLQ